MVASPGPSNPSSQGSLLSAPYFVTNQTSKAKYRECLRRWISILNELAKTDSKAKGVLLSAGNMIYLACDEIAQNLLSQAENSGRISLMVGDDDPTGVKTIEGIIDVIAKDSPAEKVNKELELLSMVHNCVRGATEGSAEFANRFNGAVAKYVNHTNSLDENTSRQFAAMLIRNARFSPDTTNSVSLQLVMLAHGKKTEDPDMRVSLRGDDAKSLLGAMKGEDMPSGAASRVQTVLERAIARSSSAKECEATRFTLEEAVQAVSQIKLRCSEIDSSAPSTAPQGSLLGKRLSRDDNPGAPTLSIEERKKMSRCRECKQLGHWVRDRADCMEKWRAKRRLSAEKKKANGDTVVQIDEKPPPAGPSGSLFP